MTQADETASWWYEKAGERQGPVTQAELERLLRTGSAQAGTLVWTAGMAQWAPVSSVAALASSLREEPPPLPPPMPAPAPPLATAPSSPWAPYPRRLGAALIDLLLVVLVAVVPPGLIWRDAALWADHGLGERAPLAIALGALSLVAFLAYHAAMLSSPGAATIGKRLLGLRVTDEDGARLSFWRALGRTAAQNYSALLLGIGFLMPLWTQRHQALHDKLARSLVVRAGAAEPSPPAAHGPALRPWQMAVLWLAVPLTFAGELYDLAASGSAQHSAKRLHQAAQAAADKVTQAFEVTGQVAGLKREDGAAITVEVEADTGIVTAVDTRTRMKVQLTPSGQRGALKWACRLTHDRILAPPAGCVMSFR